MSSLTLLQQQMEVKDKCYLSLSSLLLRSVENMVKEEAVAIKCNTVQLYEDICHFNFLCSLLVERY